MKKSNGEKRFDSQKEGIKIVRVAAFCFAIISWIATSQGLYEYVFVNYYWQALMISFGIQSILFVFNLKLPEYFNRIGKRTPDNLREHRRYYFGKRKGNEKKTLKWTSLQKLIVGFYAVVLFSSSFFSFVYIANLTYQDTQYLDANIVLDRIYRTYLNDLDKYVNEFLELTQISYSKNLSELQKMVPNDNKNISSKSEEEFKDDLEKAQTGYDNKVAQETAAKNEFESARKTYEEPMNVRWRDKKTHDEELEQYKKANLKLLAATKAKNSAKQVLRVAKRKLSEYKPSTKVVVDTLLAEILKKSPKTSDIDSLMASLNDMVIKMEKNESGNIDFANIVTKTQELNIVMNDYLTLRRIQSSDSNAKGNNNMNGESIADLKGNLLNDNITVPIPSSSKFNIQKAGWESTWKKRFSLLEKNIKGTPEYAETNIDEVNGIVDIKLLKEFDIKKIARRIDKITRSNLSNTNALERAVGLLFSDFPFLAWFSLLFALFLDFASLLAGLFIYSTTSQIK